MKDLLRIADLSPADLERQARWTMTFMVTGWGPRRHRMPSNAWGSLTCPDGECMIGERSC
jgi:hypothetical protein